MSDKNTKRKFSKEFKLEAVRLVTSGGRSVSDVARSLDVHENSLYRWRNEYSTDPSGSFPGKGHLKPEEEEFHRLKNELAAITEEREILKKALAIFSQHRK